MTFDIIPDAVYFIAGAVIAAVTVAGIALLIRHACHPKPEKPEYDPLDLQW